MKLALAHVDLPNQARGGVAIQVHALANALVERGHEVTMFTFSPPYDDCRYRVHQYGSPPPTRRLRSLALAARLAGTDFSRFDLLHTNGDGFLVPRRVPRLRTFYGSAHDEVRAAVTVRARAHYALYTWLEAIDARRARLCVGISEATRARIPQVRAIIPCGVDTTRFAPAVKSEEPSVLFVGTHGGRKRGAWLAERFDREVRARLPNARLWAVSEAPLPYDGVVNCGRVPLPRLIELYQQAWVFCLPSTYEGFGVPYIEALAAGTAVVATPNAGAQEVLAQGDYGVIAGDEALGEALYHLLQDEERRDHYARQGIARAQEFQWDRIAARYEEIYEQVAISRQRSAVSRTRRAADG